jgi:hypothetical protein
MIKRRNTVALVLVVASIVVMVAPVFGTKSLAGCTFDGDICLSGSQFANDHFLLPAAQMMKFTPGHNPPQCTFKNDPDQTISTPASPGWSNHGERRKFWRSDTGNTTYMNVDEPTSDACPLKTLREQWGMMTFSVAQNRLTWFFDIKPRDANYGILPAERYSFHGCHTYLSIAWNGCDACPEAFAALGSCECIFTTPIILSMIPGQRFDIENLDAGEGRPFDVNGDGKKSLMAFPKDVANVGFLYIKTAEFITEEDGTKTPNLRLTGQNLFGNADGYENGFKKLARYDDPQVDLALNRVVGPPNGVINAQDGVWKNLLRVWFDLNRNGEAEDSELKTLDELNIEALDLTYTVSERKDGKGNRLPLVGRFWKRGETQPYFMVDYIAAVKKIEPAR